MKKLYRLFWLVVLPFWLYVYWILFAWVFHLARVSADMQNRGFAAFMFSFICSAVLIALDTW